MSDLSFIEKTKLEKLFQMGGGPNSRGACGGDRFLRAPSHEVIDEIPF